MSIPTPPHDPYAYPPQQSGPDAWGQPSAPEPAHDAGAPYGHPAGHPSGYPSAPTGHATGDSVPTSGPVSGAAPGTDLGADLGGALKFASDSLLRNPVAFLVAGLIYIFVLFALIAAGVGVGAALMIPQLEAAQADAAAEASALLTFYAVLLVAGLLTIPFSLMWQAGSAHAGGVILDGGRPRLQQALVSPMRIFLTALLVGVITTIGFILLYIPGLIATVMLMFAIPAAVRGASPVAAVKESFIVAKSHPGTTILAALMLGVIGSIASMLLIVVFALIPFVILFQLGLYERLSGRQLPVIAKA